MKRVTFIFLFFCLSITTILAQVVTTNIATPVAGLSTNSVTDFDVNSDGTILNNSAASGTATLGSTAVTGNGNITTGSEANLILLQVTGTSGSDLDGTIEVFGGEAGVIIANPNGIECDGCAFTNVSRVDLVTGSGYDADTNTFSTIAATDIDITSSGLTAPVLKVQTGADFNNAGAIVADTVTIDVTNFGNDIKNSGTVSSDSLNIIVTDYFGTSTTSFNGFSFNNLAITAGNTFSIQSVLDLDNLTVNTGAGFEIQSTINANSLTAATNNFQNRGIINVDSLTVTAESYLNNLDNATINATSFTATVGADFNNVSGSTINADSFTVTAKNFYNVDDSISVRYSTINATSFTATIEESFNNNQSAMINADSITITANEFNTDNSTIDADTVTIEVPNFASNISNAGTISSDSLNFILTDDFTHESTSFTSFTNFSNLAITTEGTFTNNDTIDLDGNLTITANSFANSGGVVADALTVSVAGDFDYGTITANAYNLQVGGDFSYNDSANDFVWGDSDILTVSGSANITAADFANSGTIAADTFSLSVTGAFDYITDYANGTITANNYNLTVGGDFSYDDSANDFTWRANDSLTVLSNFNIVAADFANSGAITVTDSLNITANTFANSGGEIDAATFSISVAGDFDYLADYLGNGSITTNAFNLQVGGDFSNNDSASDFTWNANDSLVVSGNADITTNNYTQSGAITVDGVWTINALTDFTYSNANNDFIWDTNDSLVVSGNANITTNNFANDGTISADTFTLSLAGNFESSGTITTNAYNLQVGGDFSYDDSANDFVWRTNDTLTVSGNASIVAAGFENSGTITVTDSLNLTANTFANSGGVLDAGTFNLNVAGDFDYVADFLNNGTITANSYNLNVDGDFSYDDSANDFVLGLNDTLTVLGSANIVAADFANSGTIAVTGSFGITAAGFDNSSIIRASSIFNVTVATFTNQTGATITAAECNFVHDSFTDEGSITCLNSNTIEATVDNIAEPNNSGLSVNNYETFHIPSNGRVFNNSVSGATSQLLGDVPANPNFNGNAANIILAQVSGTEISLLLGAFEVVGSEAGLIIANPNGISCNGCSFINASEVDLRTDNSIAIADNGLDAADVDILNIRAGSFTNTGVLNANILNLNVDGDFDYTQRGIINTTIFNLEVDGVFSNNDASIGFVWEERDTLTVSGNANITALNFINHGSINVADSGSFEITTGYTAINQGSIASDILAINAADFFRNLTDGDIDVASLNITAGGKVTNTANINVTGTLTITANDDSTRTDDRTGFYVSNRGNITATTLNITAVDNFYNRGNITATNFTASAKSVFLLNREINSFDGIYDGGNISLTRNSSLIAAGIIENYGNIDLGVFNLDISADSFTNHASATITANTVNLDVASYINDGSIDAVIVSDTTSDQ